MSDYKIKDDALIRMESQWATENGVECVHAKLVITKEEFIACYNAWVKKGTEETKQ